MKLNFAGRQELRAEIENALDNVIGKRIHLDKDLLESLLFEECVCNEETGNIAKIPIWSGDFLSKIDLSEVSFDNVSWSLLGYSKDYGDDSRYDDLEIDTLKIRTMYHKVRGANLTLPFIDYSYTNANIDFSKSWEAKNMDGKYIVACCDFSGMNLSNNNLEDSILITDTNFSNAKINLTQSILDNQDLLNNYFSGIDLSDLSINSSQLMDENLHFCNFSNTGINIKIDPIDNKEHEEYFREMMEEDYFAGCILDGKKYCQKKKKRQMHFQ